MPDNGQKVAKKILYFLKFTETYASVKILKMEQLQNPKANKRPLPYFLNVESNRKTNYGACE